MDKATPESLLQFMDSATSSVRAALEQPLGKKNSVNDYIQKYVVSNTPSAREKRRQKCSSRRQRGNQKYHNHPNWVYDDPSQSNFLQDVLGCAPQPGGQATQWEEDLQWSPNMTRGISDDSPNNSPHIQASGDFHQRSQYCDIHYGHRDPKDMYSNMSHQNRNYSSTDRTRTLEDVVNTMPIGCHLPPPIANATSSERMAQERNSVSLKMIPMLLGKPRSEDEFHKSRTIAVKTTFGQQRINAPSMRKTQVPTRSQVSKKQMKPNTGNYHVPSSRNGLPFASQTSFSNDRDRNSLTCQMSRISAAHSDWSQMNSDGSPASMELLSELVTVLDKTKTLDELSANFQYENMGYDGSSADNKLQTDAYSDQFSNVYENNGTSLVQKNVNPKACSGSTWEANKSHAERRMKFATRSTSFDLVCALEDTHLGNSEKHERSQHQMRRLEENRLLNGVNSNYSLKRNSSSMEVLHIDTGCNYDPGNAKTSRRNPGSSTSHNHKQRQLLKLHERNSMPNLYPNTNGNSLGLMKSRGPKTVHENFLLSSSRENMNTVCSTGTRQPTHSPEFLMNNTVARHNSHSHIPSGLTSFGSGGDQWMKMTHESDQEYGYPSQRNMYPFNQDIGSSNSEIHQEIGDHMNIASGQYIDKTEERFQTYANNSGSNPSGTQSFDPGHHTSCQENTQSFNISDTALQRRSPVSLRRSASQMFRIDNQGFSYPQNRKPSTETHEHGYLTTTENFSGKDYHRKSGCPSPDSNFDFDNNIPVSQSEGNCHNNFQRTCSLNTATYGVSNTNQIAMGTVQRHMFSANIGDIQNSSSNVSVSDHPVQNFQLQETNSQQLKRQNNSVIDEGDFQNKMEIGTQLPNLSNVQSSHESGLQSLVPVSSDSNPVLMQSDIDTNKCSSNLAYQLANSKQSGQINGTSEKFTIHAEQNDMSRMFTANPQTSPELLRSKMNPSTQQFQVLHESNQLPFIDSLISPFSEQHHPSSNACHSNYARFDANDPIYGSSYSYNQNLQYDPSLWLKKLTDDGDSGHEEEDDQEEEEDEEEEHETEYAQDYHTNTHATPCDNEPPVKLPSFSSTFLQK